MRRDSRVCIVLIHYLFFHVCYSVPCVQRVLISERIKTATAATRHCILSLCHCDFGPIFCLAKHVMYLFFVCADSTLFASPCLPRCLGLGRPLTTICAMNCLFVCARPFTMRNGDARVVSYIVYQRPPTSMFLRYKNVTRMHSEVQSGYVGIRVPSLAHASLKKITEKTRRIAINAIEASRRTLTRSRHRQRRPRSAHRAEAAHSRHAPRDH